MGFLSGFSKVEFVENYGLRPSFFFHCLIIRPYKAIPSGDFIENKLTFCLHNLRYVSELI